MGPVRTYDAETWTPIVKESGGCPRVSTQEEGIHQVSGESSSRTREPEQGLDWGAQVAQGALLQSKDRLKQRFGGCASRNQGLLSLFFFCSIPPFLSSSLCCDLLNHRFFVSFIAIFFLSFDHVLLCKDPEGLLGWKMQHHPEITYIGWASSPLYPYHLYMLKEKEVGSICFSRIDPLVLVGKFASTEFLYI